MSSPSPYTVTEMTSDNIVETALLAKLAFSTHIVMGTMWNNVEDEIYVQRFIPLFSAPGSRNFIIPDPETGKIVAWTRWVYPHTLTPEQKEKKEEAKKVKQVYPPGARADMAADFFQKISAVREEYIDHEKMFFVHILVIHPDYQRKGLGTKLLERGLTDVDAAGARAYIEATRGGYGLYKKYGFVDVGKISMDLDSFGLEGGIDDMPFLIREPQGVQITKPIL